ncbi:MAG: hypothetical protein GX369_08525 [Euryarchaeota archaeon]|nr:hypothetical protein [Euryarchaeota archaeon]
MLKTLKGFWKDERGGITTTEVIGYTLLIGGAVALVGFGYSSLARGKTGNIFNAVENMKAMSGEIAGDSTYGYTETVDEKTGIAIGATGN